MCFKSSLAGELFNSAALVDVLDEALILLADARDNLAADPADISYLADAGYRARTRLYKILSHFLATFR